MQPEESAVGEVIAPELPPLDHPRMLAAMKSGVAEALRKHRDQGVPIITWDLETQQIVEIPADQIPTWINDPTSQT